MAEVNHKNFENVPVMWKPDENSGKNMREFMKRIEKKYNVKLDKYWDVHKWSIENLEDFWAEIWDMIGMICSKSYDKVIDLSIPMYKSPEWFEGSRMNYAENILKYRDDHVAIIETGEDKKATKTTYAELYKESELYAAALRKHGVKKGDRISCVMSNRKEAVLAMLGTTSIGAIFLGALPLLGPQAVLNRFKQVEPKILFTIDRFSYNREEKEMLDKVKEIADNLPSLEKVIIVPSKPESKLKDISGIRNSCFLDEFLKAGKEKDGSVPKMVFEQVPFTHPVFINYTSGTTGLPKALIHSSGIILSMSRDIWLHNDSDRTSCWLSMSSVGWATWNMLSTMHNLGITVVLFEGVPYYLGPTYLWDLVDEFKITSIPLAPKVLDELEKRGYIPNENNHLKSLKVILCAGSVVKPQNYDFVYKKIKSDVVFSSAYNSTELMGSCMTLEQTLNIHRGEITAPSLGMDIACVDDTGRPLIGEIGELVINKSSPSLPLGLWGDKDHSKYKSTYFSKFPGKFALDDMAVINPVTKGIIVCGRSDETLQPGGCRFGSSEIYNIVDTFPEIHDSVCVSQYNKNRDERAILFLKMKKGHLFNEALVKRIRVAIAKELSVRHVPEVIIETADIPYNMNGKKVEIIVKKIINKMPYNPESIINPKCLENFMDVPELGGF